MTGEADPRDARIVELEKQVARLEGEVAGLRAALPVWLPQYQPQPWYGPFYTTEGGSTT